MPNRSNMRSNRGSNDVVKAGDAARATEAGSNLYKDRSNWYVVTMPNGGTVISSQLLLHNENGDAVNGLTKMPVKNLDLAAVSLLAKFIVLNNENVTFVKFSSNKVINAYLPWINIFQFLFGETFQTHVPNNPAQQLARFSACIARPSLLLATDDVVRAALCGDEDLARRMITLNPNYLLQRGNAMDFSSRIYTDITPFQAALITGDDKMAKMMKPFFDCLPNGEAEMQRQFAEIFPNGIDAHEVAQKRKSEIEFVPMLDELIAAIKNASYEDLDNNRCNPLSNNSILGLALNKFRAAFTDLSHSEKIFNPYYLLAVSEAYVNKFDWKNLNWLKLSVFIRQMIGFVQRFLPATYAQAFAYSLYAIVENKHSCPRSFNFRYHRSISFYPLSNGLGSYFAAYQTADSWLVFWVSSHHSIVAEDRGKPFMPEGFNPTRISKFISNKKQQVSELIPPRAICCVIQ